MYTVWFGAVSAKQLAAAVRAKMLGHSSARIGAVAKGLCFTLHAKAFSRHKHQSCKCRTAIFSAILAVAVHLKQRGCNGFIAYLAT